MFAKSSRLSKNSYSNLCNEQTERLFTSIGSRVSFLESVWQWINSTLEYGIDILPLYISPMIVAYGSSKIVSYSKDMSGSLYVAEVSPVHKITFSGEFNSSLSIKSSLSLYGYTGYLKKSKFNGIENLLSNVFFIAFF